MCIASVSSYQGLFLCKMFLQILTSNAALEILDDIDFRGNPSKADLTSKDQVLQ